MKYTLLIYNSPDLAPELETEEQQQAAAQEWYTFIGEAKAAGVLVDNDGFAPVSSTTTVRVRDGKTLVTDGPFAETHEQLGGYHMLDCKDLDEAIKWAAKSPGAKYGAIEVRPMWNTPTE